MPGKKGPELNAPLDSRLSHLLVGVISCSEFGSCRKIHPFKWLGSINEVRPTRCIFLQVQCLCPGDTALFVFLFSFLSGPGLRQEGMDLGITWT